MTVAHDEGATRTPTVNKTGRHCPAASIRIQSSMKSQYVPFLRCIPWDAVPVLTRQSFPVEAEVEIAAAPGEQRRTFRDEQRRSTDLAKRIERSARSSETGQQPRQSAVDDHTAKRSIPPWKDFRIGTQRGGSTFHAFNTLAGEPGAPRRNTAVSSIRPNESGLKPQSIFQKSSIYKGQPRQVDLTEEITSVASEHSAKNRPLSDAQHRTSGRGTTAQAQLFSTEEFRNVDRYTNVDHDLSFRKQRRPSHNHQYKDSVRVVVDSSEVERPSFGSPPDDHHRRIEHTRRKFSEIGLRDHEDMLKDIRDLRAAERGDEYGLPRRSVKRRRLSNQSNIRTSSDELAPSITRPRLNDVFVRVDNSHHQRSAKQPDDSSAHPSTRKVAVNSPQSRPHARHRMMSSSATESLRKVSPIDDDMASGDELLGGTTVRSRARKAESSPGRLISASARRSSPGELLPSQFSGHTLMHVQTKSTSPQDSRNGISFVVEKYSSSQGVCESESPMRLTWNQILASFRLSSAAGKFADEIIFGRLRTWIKYNSNLAQIIINNPIPAGDTNMIGIEFESASEALRFVEFCQNVKRTSQFEIVPEGVLAKSYNHLLTVHENKADSLTNINQHQARSIAGVDQANTKTDSSNKRNMDDKGVQSKQIPSTISAYFDQPSDVRRSSRRHLPRVSLAEDNVIAAPKRWTVENRPRRWPESIVYPKVGPKRVTVDFQDLERLDEGEFLNDNVISFALRRVEEGMSTAVQERTHLFNTFFYSALTTSHGRKQFNYDAVKRWTKSIDIFSKSFVVIPINNDLHWFVAIICNLPKLISVKDEPTLPKADDCPSETADTDKDEEFPSHATAGASPAKALEGENFNKDSTDVFKFGDDGRVVSSPDRQVDTVTQTPKREKRARMPPLRKYDPESCVIITLDSLGTPHTSEVRHLKEYIAHEAREKRGLEIDIGELQGMTAKGIPEQTNFCDCGLYLVGYVEQFAKDPDAFIRKVLAREMDRQSDFAGFDPSAKRTQLRDELLSLQHKQETDKQHARALKKRQAQAP